MERFLPKILPSNTSVIDQQNSTNSPFMSESFIVVTCFFIFSIFIRFLSEYLHKNRRRLFKHKPHPKTTYLQCHKCRYFGSNAYLNCSLHPVTVLTEEAAGCCDYTPISKIKR